MERIHLARPEGQQAQLRAEWAWSLFRLWLIKKGSGSFSLLPLPSPLGQRFAACKLGKFLPRSTTGLSDWGSLALRCLPWRKDVMILLLYVTRPGYPFGGGGSFPWRKAWDYLESYDGLGRIWKYRCWAASKVIPCRCQVSSGPSHTQAISNFLPNKGKSFSC